LPKSRRYAQQDYGAAIDGEAEHGEQKTFIGGSPKAHGVASIDGAADAGKVPQVSPSSNALQDPGSEGRMRW
jgi:hypothetical protein